MFAIRRSIGFIANDTKQNLHSVLKIMDNKTKTVVNENGCRFSTTFVTGGILKENNNGLFSSNCFNRLSDYPNAGVSKIELGDKRFVINNITGEVLPEKFSLQNFLFGSSKKIIQNVSDTINKVKENFENPKIVKQHQWGIDGFTEKGSKIIEEAKKHAQSLRAKN